MINEIIVKSLNHKLTKEEELTLNEWLGEKEENKDYYHRIRKIDVLQKIVSNEISDDENLSLSQVKENIFKPRRKMVRRDNLLIKYAAVFTGFILLIGGAYFSVKMKQERHILSEVKTRKAEKTSTQFKAMLINGDEVVHLDGNTHKTVVGSISMENNNEAQCVKLTSINSTKEVTYSSIVVPKGCRYTVMLPDSSQVWLNSESELTFPNHFSDTLRMVTIRGEGFFKVAHSNIAPFVVQFNGNKVRVLGTEFNVNTYKEHDTKITLVTGKVSVNNQKETIILNPSQQAVISSKNGAMSSLQVDTGNYTSWITGRFYYSDMPFEEIAHDLSRRFGYDFKIHDKELQKEKITLKLSNKTTLIDVIQMLNKIGETIFKAKLDAENQEVIIYSL